MAYYTNLFSPETYYAFTTSDRTVSGVKERQQSIAAAIRPGDKLICYMTKLSRWVGVLEVTSTYFVDSTPVFLPSSDPFKVRFQVLPRVWLFPENAIPIRHDICWNRLSFTRDSPRNSSTWTGTLRSSLRKLSDEDGRYLEELLTEQQSALQDYELTPADRKKLLPSLVNSEHGQIPVSIPDDEGDVGEETDADDRPADDIGHVQLQAALADIGDKMGFKIWLPRNDRQRVLEIWEPTSSGILLEHLPLNFDQLTLRIIENIDVLWIRRKAIIHAFEVEHSTSIYSGLLRMADLMTVQPNLSIKAHIVAPMARRTKVLQEISRPVFSLIESGPMSETCSFLSYDAVLTLGEDDDLPHMNDSILDKYTEYASETDF